MKCSRPTTFVFCWILCAVFHTGAIQAEAVFDGTVGPPGSLSGNMTVPATQGTQVGNNLFHSFSTFNINTGESALFTGPATTSNVISRVTGVTSSTIDGALDHNMPNASFWLINPNGIIFGQNASLPTTGAFHASTADYLLLEDGGRFGADTTLPENTVLTLANPSTFGFLDTSPGIDKLTYTPLHILEKLPSMSPLHISKTQRLAILESGSSWQKPNDVRD